MTYNILAVDHNAEHLESFKALLEKQGYMVRTATSVKDAMHELRADLPHLLITEISLHDRPGSDLIMEVRRDDNLKPLPIIVRAARDNLSDRVYLLQLGTDAFISKNQSTDECLAVIAAVLRRLELDKCVTRLGSALVDRRVGKLYFDGVPLQSLTQEEFRIIALLAERSPNVVSERELSHCLRRAPESGSDLDTVIESLRAKLPPDMVKPARRETDSGYRFTPV
ncbi:MAG: response regulator transcription factor [bacterium]